MHVLRERLEVALEECIVDGIQAFAARQFNGEHHVPTHQARVHQRASRGRIHRRDPLTVADILQRELIAIVPVLVVKVRTHQRYGCLRHVIIKLRHVQVVDKVNEPCLALRAIIDSRLLLERPLQNFLQRARVGVIVEGDGAEHVVAVRFFLQLAKLAGHLLRFTSARFTYQHDRVATRQQDIAHEVNLNGFRRRHCNRRHLHAAVVFHHWHDLLPGLEALCFDIDIVIEHFTARRELDRLKLRFPPRTKLLLVVDVILSTKRGAEGPNHREHDVGL